VARFVMVTDLRKCVACQACTVACSAEWGVAPGYARTRAGMTPVAGTFPDLTTSPRVDQCNHCDDAPCLEPCPSGATYRDGGGVVRVDAGVCIGCGFCVEACPYDARFVDPRTKKVDKCDFCAPRVARGEQPACVATCTAHAKYFGDLEDRSSDVFRLVFREGARRMETKAIAVGPNVYYLGRREQLDHVLASAAPRAPRLLTAGETWRRLVRPLVIGAAGAAFIGQAIAFFAQVRKGEEDSDE
jgi:Fe-S-cluster-containing dehydrogenase component